MRNRTLIQFFEWYLPNDGSLWNEAKEKAFELKKLGITDVWLPPAYKGQAGSYDVGYGVYDMYDLGEFDQKGTVRTKYGTKDEYISAIKSMQNEGLRVFADVVFNHRMGADGKERVNAMAFETSNRGLCRGVREIEAWTKFDFPNRQGKYSDFKWNHTHFDGCDYDDIKKENGLFLFEGKSWDDGVDIEKGNYDYLMGADLDLSNEETFNEIVNWGKWCLDTTGVDGFRIDAVKHINFPKMRAWLRKMREYSGEELFTVGEYWNSTLSALTYYLDRTANSMHLFDVPLHYNFYKASTSNGNFDMRKILEGTLVNERPKRAVTIVDNHDTQPGQALESYVLDWFKLHAYSLILLREEGTPCVFYGDLYGIANNNIAPLGEKLEAMIKIRQDLAYGEQIDYFNNSDIIGFTRLGEKNQHFSGLAVVMTDKEGGFLEMSMGEKFVGKTLVDALGNTTEKVCVCEDGLAKFPVNNGSVSVYVDEDYLKR